MLQGDRGVREGWGQETEMQQLNPPELEAKWKINKNSTQTEFCLCFFFNIQVVFKHTDEHIYKF